jgi:hypothetical protein
MSPRTIWRVALVLLLDSLTLLALSALIDGFAIDLLPDGQSVECCKKLW